MRIHVLPRPALRFRIASPPRIRYNSTATTRLPRTTAPSPFAFIPSHSEFAKRPPRPFPPPFNTPPASSFSDPLTAATYSRPGYTRPQKQRTEGASFLSGLTNGDDALLATSTHLAVADGVGAWNTKSHGHAALWSRLMLHYWSSEVQTGKYEFRDPEGGVDPVLCLQEAYTKTVEVTANNEAGDNQSWQGTTTVCCAVLKDEKVLVLNLGDSVGLVYRPGEKGWALRTSEQWHWFDCPRQLGTNSPDTPVENAVVQQVEVQDGDLVILATDGLVDNIWDEEILEIIRETMAVEEETVKETIGEGGDRGRMAFLADRLVDGAKKTAIDPFAESPYMERSIEEGLGIEGGKFDDITVVAAVCRLRCGAELRRNT